MRQAGKFAYSAVCGNIYAPLPTQSTLVEADICGVEKTSPKKAYFIENIQTRMP